jgi:Tfp pilus assembly protein PilN
MRAVNLLPRDEPRQRRQAPGRETQIAIAAPLLAVLLIVVGFVFASSRVSANQSQLRSLQSELAALPKPKGPKIDPALTSQHQLRVTALAQAMTGRIAWDRVLRHVSAVLPDDVWLSKLATVSSTPTTPTPPTTTATTDTTTTATTSTSTTPAIPLTPPTVTQLEIDGYTYSQAAVARFVARLQVVPDLSDVTVKTSTMTLVGGKEIDQFTIVGTVRTDEAATS